MRRDRNLTVRVTGPDLQRLALAAKAEGVSLSNFVRRVLLPVATGTAGPIGGGTARARSLETRNPERERSGLAPRSRRPP